VLVALFEGLLGLFIVLVFFVYVVSFSLLLFCCEYVVDSWWFVCIGLGFGGCCVFISLVCCFVLVWLIVAIVLLLCVLVYFVVCYLLFDVICFMFLLAL